MITMNWARAMSPSAVQRRGEGAAGGAAGAADAAVVSDMTTFSYTGWGYVFEVRGNIPPGGMRSQGWSRRTQGPDGPGPTGRAAAKVEA
ncbi:hypothetical protein GCM10009639_32610 [Kitasatospora putterlickiae]|uniref:Uncharacterized protein n=1 Tax=Kitasatospora putterlickiae TaxID=221725 RepID=A0ABN1Y2U0_9ACTN